MLLKWNGDLDSNLRICAWTYHVRHVYTSLDILVSDPYTVEIWGASWPFVSCNTRRVRKHVFQPHKRSKNFEGSKMIGTRHGTNMGPWLWDVRHLLSPQCTWDLEIDSPGWNVWLWTKKTSWALSNALSLCFEDRRDQQRIELHPYDPAEFLANDRSFFHTLPGPTQHV